MIKRAARSFIGTLWGAFAVGLLLADEPKPIEFARFEAYTEGPVFDYDHNLYVSHATDSVSRIAPDGTVTLWLKADRPNGHKVLQDGTHLLCIKGAVLHLDGSGRNIKRVFAACGGSPLRHPNDITLSRRGGFYFTDPGGSRNAPIGSVHYVNNGGEMHLVAGGLWVPNGLVLSPDEDRLYVAETVPNRILWYPVAADGLLGELNVFADLPASRDSQAEPDGLAVDARGNLYVAHLGMSSVQVLSPDGRLLTTLPAGNYDASNLVFGGPELDQLFVTGSIGHRTNTPGRVYRLELPGVEGLSSLLPPATAGLENKD